MLSTRDYLHSEQDRTQSGSILILTSIVLIGLLTFAGLAIDAGNLYRARLAAQNAADATALAIVNYINIQGKIRIEEDAAGGHPDADRGKRSGQVTAYLKTFVEQLARSNMEKSGWKNDEAHGYGVAVNSNYFIGDPKTSPGDPSFRYSVTVSRPVEYLLMSRIPFINTQFATVTATAVSDRKVANVAIMLDVSGSLGCPRTGVCTCLNDGNCPLDNRKFDDLVEGVREFIKLFDLENDNISIAAYNLAARTLSMEELRGFIGAEPPVTEDDIDKIAEYLREQWTPSGPTNICDAITEASGTMARVAPEETVSYVLFSDGAPTAGRFLFADDVAKPAKLEKNNLGYGDYDYSMYTVDWPRPAGTVPAGESKTYPAPSVLLQSGALISPLREMIGAYIEDPAAPPRPASDATCHDGLKQSPKVTDPSQIPAAVNAVISPCLKSMTARMPGADGALRTYGSEYVDGTAGAKTDWRKQYFHCAIELADYLRLSRQATFYTLGLGTPAAGLTPADAYGNIEDTSNRKDVFLSRLTFDIKKSNEFAPKDGTGKPVRQRFDYREYRDYDDLPSGSSRQYGLYLPTHRSEELRMMFQQIARKVLLRLVS